MTFWAPKIHSTGFEAAQTACSSWEKELVSPKLKNYWNNTHYCHEYKYTSCSTAGTHIHMGITRVAGVTGGTGWRSMMALEVQHCYLVLLLRDKNYALFMSGSSVEWRAASWILLAAGSIQYSNFSQCTRHCS
jgi:hypothetical protein